jgi:hypothetical protein
MILKVRQKNGLAKRFRFNVNKYSDIAYYTHYGDDISNKTIHIVDEDNLCYYLATMMFDCASNSYHDFIDHMRDIEKIFGKEILDKVLDNLKNRNHDT